MRPDQQAAAQELATDAQLDDYIRQLLGAEAAPPQAGLACYQFALAELKLAVPVAQWQLVPDFRGESMAGVCALHAGRKLRLVDAQALLRPQSAVTKHASPEQSQLLACRDRDIGILAQGAVEEVTLDHGELLLRGAAGQRPWLHAVIPGKRIVVLSAEGL